MLACMHSADQGCFLDHVDSFSRAGHVSSSSILQSQLDWELASFRENVNAIRMSTEELIKDVRSLVFESTAVYACASPSLSCLYALCEPLPLPCKASLRGIRPLSITYGITSFWFLGKGGACYERRTLKLPPLSSISCPCLAPALAKPSTCSMRTNHYR